MQASCGGGKLAARVLRAILRVRLRNGVSVVFPPEFPLVCWPVRTRTRLLERAIAPPSRLPVTAFTICTGGGRRPRNRSSRLYGFTQNRPAIAAAIAAAVAATANGGYNIRRSCAAGRPGFPICCALARSSRDPPPAAAPAPAVRPCRCWSLRCAHADSQPLPPAHTCAHMPRNCPTQGA